MNDNADGVYKHHQEAEGQPRESHDLRFLPEKLSYGSGERCDVEVVSVKFKKHAVKEGDKDV
jgi:hypothetical protein